MPVYIAMLRGINVGPHKRMKMEKLRACCEGAGFRDVKTYIQSGNVALRADRISSSALETKLAERIVDDFGFSSTVIARTLEEMKAVIEGNPLLKADKGLDPAKLHVVFLADKPSPAETKKLEEVIVAPDRVHTSGRETYFYFPNGVSGSSLWKHPLDQVIAVPGTMRNWNTVNKLYQIARDLA
jgi:uncharacterized protein (DUF1697 family)